MAGTLLDCITGALNMIGMLGSGQSPSPEDAAQGFREGNLLLSSSSTNRLMLYNVSTLQFVLAANMESYTLGPSGLFVQTPRPTFIESAQINVGATGVWLPVSILTKSQWDSIKNRSALADVPDSMYPDYSFPNLTINVNPRPVGTPAMRFGAWLPLTQFTTVFDQIANLFPAEYEEWIQASLAVRLSPYYDQAVTPDIAARAQRAEAAVMSKNAQGLGGALSDGQKMMSPNLGQPLPTGPAAAGVAQ